MLIVNDILAPLQQCGYRPDLIRFEHGFSGSTTLPLVAFSHHPADSRSSSIAVLPGQGNSPTQVEGCRYLGAPIVFVCAGDILEWWKQGTATPELLERIPESAVERFFLEHVNQFSPDAVYRAKNWGRFRPTDQLSFVDLGLMPVIQEEAGRALERLVGRNVAELKERVGWAQPTSEQGQWLLKAVFWLLSGKILKDKRVPTFENLNLRDTNDVFRRVANHYGSSFEELIEDVTADHLSFIAADIDQFSDLSLTTTESLGYVYENAFISEETRAMLGTHSTPSFLVDYIVGSLADWIGDIPVDLRNVLEPCCGQAAFLVSAMRLLTELLPGDAAFAQSRRKYLRDRLHGTDIDSFAIELARLSLTLTDIPNPDGWDLRVQNVFVGQDLSKLAQRSTILLANGPFEDFDAAESRALNERHSEPRFVNKSAEMLWRTIPHLPAGAVFGVVIPQTLLHRANGVDLRGFLARHCELMEISLFPDKVFEFSESESAVIIGRRTRPSQHWKVGYRRLQERDLARFRLDTSSVATSEVDQSRFLRSGSFSFRVPDLDGVWEALRECPRLEDISTVGKGLDYKADLPDGAITNSEEPISGFEPGFVRSSRKLQLHEVPNLYWLNLDASLVSRFRSGAQTGIQQVLLTYGRASRGPWRLKALVDDHGRAFTSSFIGVRPRSPIYTVEILWALLNSPVANAFAFSHLSTRNNIVGDIRKIPIPKASQLDDVHSAAVHYLQAARSRAQEANLNQLLLEVDAEVLRLYSLPLTLERAVLGLFTGWNRVGVPFPQSRYLPQGLEEQLSLHDFVHFERDWPAANKQRGELIDKSIAGVISDKERLALGALQVYADYHLEKRAPRPDHLLHELEMALTRSALKGERLK